MRVEAGVREAFPFIFPEKPAVAQDNVINFIAWTPAIEPVPLFLGLLPFSET